MDEALLVLGMMAPIFLGSVVMAKILRPPAGYMTIQAFADLHGVSRTKVDQWVNTCKVPYVNVNGHRYVKADVQMVPRFTARRKKA